MGTVMRRLFTVVLTVAIAAIGAFRAAGSDANPAAETALEETSDAALRSLLDRAQPSWTSPDGGYGRTR